MICNKPDIDTIIDIEFEIGKSWLELAQRLADRHMTVLNMSYIVCKCNKITEIDADIVIQEAGLAATIEALSAMFTATLQPDTKALDKAR